MEKKEETLNIQDQYIKNIRYGITSIDTNLDLKRFITKQNDKKNLQTDQTQKDIRLFMENFCNQKREVIEKLDDKDAGDIKVMNTEFHAKKKKLTA